MHHHPRQGIEPGNGRAGIMCFQIGIHDHIAQIGVSCYQLLEQVKLHGKAVRLNDRAAVFADMMAV